MMSSNRFIFNYSPIQTVGSGRRLGLIASWILALQMPWIVSILIVDTVLIGGAGGKGPSGIHVFIHLALTFAPCLVGICGALSIKLSGHKRNAGGIIGLYGQFVFILYLILPKLIGAN
jgi:hypothetical protein